jgi:hypothetical protein
MIDNHVNRQGNFYQIDPRARGAAHFQMIGQVIPAAEAVPQS